MTRTMPWGASGSAPLTATALNLAAGVLRAAGDLLERRATHLAEAAQAEAQAAADELLRASVETVEFHPMFRDAGAPEGALYINGKLVGVISGVDRL
ncbi:MAG TPA: hypothetical protein VMZ74_03690 [Ramlibacter sp.]|nr:hypothetical protein [Ramlibacter sp.]